MTGMARKEQGVWEPLLSWMKGACALSRRETLPHSSQLLNANGIPRSSPDKAAAQRLRNFAGDALSREGPDSHTVLLGA